MSTTGPYISPEPIPEWHRVDTTRLVRVLPKAIASSSNALSSADLPIPETLSITMA